MQSLRYIVIAGVVLLSACDAARKPNDANFTIAINQYLAKHGEACTSIGQQFPIDVPRLEQNGLSAIGAKMAALERAGLVYATDTTTVVHGLLEPLRGPTPPQAVRRYD